MKYFRHVHTCWLCVAYYYWVSLCSSSLMQVEPCFSMKSTLSQFQGLLTGTGSPSMGSCPLTTGFPPVPMQRSKFVIARLSFFTAFPNNDPSLSTDLSLTLLVVFLNHIAIFTEIL